jgi:hypothetical protein
MCHWDPNLLPGFGVVALGPCRIYGDERCEIAALVDRDDYHWLSQWRWSPKWSRGHKKFYLRRTLQTVFQECGYNEHTGQRERVRVQKTLFLHTAVILRTGIAPPSPEHCLVDHIDGNSLNCQRHNLRWATPKMNAQRGYRS